MIINVTDTKQVFLVASGKKQISWQSMSEIPNNFRKLM
jgi:hypothetical protein